MTAESELIKIRRACTHPVTEDRLNLVEFGTCLRRLRQDAGFSLREIARFMDLSAPFLGDCERGFRRMRLTHQIKYLKCVLPKEKLK